VPLAGDRSAPTPFLFSVEIVGTASSRFIDLPVGVAINPSFQKQQ
jgi:hypothetical protein